METEGCNTNPCPIDGNYTEWTEFSSCTKTCDGGIKIRTRNCSNPSPMHGGKNCSELGRNTIRNSCNRDRCPGEYVSN
jgi:hypothetical protein